jgi:hypothetical protein
MSSLEVAQRQYDEFLDRFRSLSLATVSPEGTPHASYAPFIQDDAGIFYIYISQLSTHTQNLRHNFQASLLALEDESQTEQIFARRRASFDCRAVPIERNTPQHQQLLDRFAQRCGEMIAVLRTLQDFQLFALTPYAGRFVMGFGGAYDIDTANGHTLKPAASGQSKP